jgi:ketosteroid isomerase-like protein
MSREQVERVLAGYAAFNRGEFEAVLAEIGDEVRWDVLDVMPDQGPYVGKEGIMRFWESWAETFSEFRAEIEEVIDTGDHVITVMHMSGRGHGSDAQMRSPTFAQIWTWEGETIAHVRMVADKDQALEMLGSEEP